MESISDRIKKGMEIRGMKQADLVEHTGISKGALSSYISGRYAPKQNNIYLIARALAVDEAWLMGFDVPMEKETSNSITSTTDDVGAQDNIRKLQSMLDSHPERTLEYLANYCRNKRIKKDKTERFIADEAHIPLEEYLDFEVNHANIGAVNLLKLLKIMSKNPSFIIGYLTGTLVSDLNEDDTDILITKIHSDDDDLSQLLKLIKRLSPEGLESLSNEIRTTLPDADIDNNPDIIDIKNTILNTRKLKAAHERTDIEVTKEMKKHDDDIMNNDSEWE